MVEKKRFFSSHAKSSAAVISVIIHAVFIVLALTFVAVRVYIKDDQTFEVKAVKRPQMKLRKLQVPVKEQKKTQAPKLRKTIVAKPKNPQVDIKMPEIVGVKGGTGYGRSGGLGGLGFNFDMDLFGANKGSGNELEGTFFDLKMEPDGTPTKMGDAEYREAIKNFIGSWNINRFESDFFKAPKNRYAIAFLLPKMQAEEAPKAYSVEDVVKPKYWVAYYSGKIAAPEDGRYRFWGGADDLLMVRIKKRLVLDGCRKGTIVSNWKSDDPRSGKYVTSSETMKIGDWFSLQGGDPVDMEVLVGERPGGLFSCTLLIEQEGVDYPKGKDGRPVLPIFKTLPIPKKIVSKMKIEKGTCTVEGPLFGVLR